MGRGEPSHHEEGLGESERGKEKYRGEAESVGQREQGEGAISVDAEAFLCFSD
jgi:hypothetical protein